MAVVFAYSGLHFDESMKTMRPPGNRGMDVAVEVGRHFGSGFDSMMLLLEGDSLDEVLELAERATAGAQGLVDEGVLYGFSGVDSLIPPPRAADARPSPGSSGSARTASSTSSASARRSAAPRPPRGCAPRRSSRGSTSSSGRSASPDRSASRTSQDDGADAAACSIAT